MKKTIATIVLILVLGGNCFAAGVTYNFSSEHVSKIIEGTCYIYKNVETIEDPEWVDPGPDPENPNAERTAPQIPKYTDSEWTKEVYRRIIIRDTRRGLGKKAIDAADGADVPDNAVTSQ